MSLQLTGTIKLIGEVQTFDSGFKKVEFVLTTNDEKYPQDVKFDISQDKVDDFLKYNHGRHFRQTRPLRGSPRGHPLPRRDRRAPAFPAGEAPAGPTRRHAPPPG